jgi:hypothetical protein
LELNSKALIIRGSESLRFNNQVAINPKTKKEHHPRRVNKNGSRKIVENYGMTKP